LRDGVPHLLFTQRPDTLRHHAGQISFPGGARDPEDVTPQITALRELREELGIPETAVEVLGSLDEIPTPSGFRVACFVGRLSSAAVLQPSPTEVAAVLELPVAAFFAEGLPRTEQRQIFGRGAEVYYYDVGPHVVWGVTGHLLRSLLMELAALPTWRVWTQVGSSL
jgi:8-oxo-dGTP pyrophosphatase MutT (NUDIX family)